jgi:hypothetical protein
VKDFENAGAFLKLLWWERNIGYFLLVIGYLLFVGALPVANRKYSITNKK